jgi:uncharacterized protein YegP (UPF0339 family)
MRHSSYEPPMSNPPDPPDEPERRVEVWHAADGWRWRKWAPNGRIVAEGGEAYTREDDAFSAAQRENPNVPVEVRK